MKTFVSSKALCAAAIVLCLILPAQASAATLFVSPDGADANPGTEAKPFATPARARDEIRKLKQAGPLREAVTVRVRGGAYFLAQTLTFEPKDSGTAQAPVTYEAFIGEEAILSGGAAITGWREVSPGRWEAHIPDVAAGKWYFSQLYVNDQRRPRPILPKEGYYFIAKQAPPTKGANPDRFYFHPGNLRADWQNLSDVEVTTFHLWTMDRLRIKEVDSARNLVTFSGATHSSDQAPLTRATWYRVENVREALTQPGEWYLDRKTGVLNYLSKPGEDMKKARVIAPRLAQVALFNGDVAKGACVEYITLRSLTIAHNAWNTPERGYGFPQADVAVDAAVTARAARNCALERCVIRHTATYAVDWGDGCHGNRVEGCEMFDLGAGGVKVGPIRLGDEPNKRKWSSGTIIRDNHIAHGGRIFPAAVGVWIGHAWANVIEHNHIFDFYYSGMSVGWKWNEGFSPAYHNTIVNNHIHDLGQGVLSDMAGIYTLGDSPATTLRLNRIHDVNRARYGGWGIYFDACSSGIVASENLVYRTQDAGLHQNYGSCNTVANNIFAYGQNGQIRLTDSRKSGAMLFERNIFYWTSENLFEKGTNPDSEMVFRRNLYWRTDGTAFRFAGGATLDEWRKREPDLLVTDPSFAAPDKDDFRLKLGLPASMIGFVPFDISSAGRTTAPNRTDVLPPPPRVFPPAPSESEMMKDFAIDDDFESYSAGQPIIDFHTQVNRGDVAAVTAEMAAGGRHSLKFQEGPGDGSPWAPHVYCFPRYKSGVVRNSFDLRVEPEAKFDCEWRDWPQMDGAQYKAGPSLKVLEDGSLTAGGKKLLTLPHRQWARFEIVCDLGASGAGACSVTVTLPGQAPQRFEGLRCHEGFKAVDWVGFCSFGKPGTAFYVDNLRLSRQEIGK